MSSKIGHEGFEDEIEDVDNNTDEEITILSEDDFENESDIQKRRADEMTAIVQRLQAEFDNYRRRTSEQTKLLREEGRAEVIEKLLPVLDSFYQAARIINDKSVLDGVNLIFDMLNTVLNGFGLKQIDALNTEFNPQYHNAVLTREEKGKSGMVVEVIQDGYILSGKVIRPASVIVGS